MAIESEVFVRVVPQDKDRGFQLIVSYIKPVIQRTASQIVTLSAVTAESYAETLESVRRAQRATKVTDITSPAVMKQMVKTFPATDLTV